MNELINKISSLCAQHDIPVFGTAHSARLENADPGYRPSDLLPTAKSIICLGMPVPKGTFACEGRSNHNYWRTANIYYRAMDALLLQIARAIEAEYGTTVPVYG